MCLRTKVLSFAEMETFLPKSVPSRVTLKRIWMHKFSPSFILLEACSNIALKNIEKGVCAQNVILFYAFSIEKGLERSLSENRRMTPLVV